MKESLLFALSSFLIGVMLVFFKKKDFEVFFFIYKDLVFSLFCGKFHTYRKSR